MQRTTAGWGVASILAAGGIAASVIAGAPRHLPDSPFTTQSAAVGAAGERATAEITAISGAAVRASGPGDAPALHATLRPAAAHDRSAAAGRPHTAPVGVRPAFVPPGEQPSPIRNIALVGVTNSGGAASAWLMDTETRERASAQVGGSAFGFTVAQIRDESVLLRRAGHSYPVRLGERPIAVVGPASESVGEPAPERPTTAPEPAAAGARAGYRSSSGESAAASPAAPFSNPESLRGREAAVTRAPRDLPTGTPEPAATSPGSGGADSPDAAGDLPGSPSDSAGYSGGYTTNPQTARRRHSHLIGSATSVKSPAPIVNPQTLRRLNGVDTGGPTAATTPGGRPYVPPSARGEPVRGRGSRSQ